MNGKNIFEAGKKTVYCIQCATRFKAADKPNRCPFCGATNLVLEPNKKEEEKKFHIVIGAYSVNQYLEKIEGYGLSFMRRDK